MPDPLLPSADLQAVLVVERLLRDPGFRRRFRAEPVGACALEGLGEMALRLHHSSTGHQALEPRELRSSVAGVVMAAAVEAAAIEHAVTTYGDASVQAVRDAAGAVDLETVDRVLRGAPEPLPPTGTVVTAPLPGEELPPTTPAATSPDPLWTPGGDGTGVAASAAVEDPAAAAAAIPADPFAEIPQTDYPGDGAGRAELARWMGAAAQEAGLPAELPVMAALVESGLRNLSYGDADSVGFFQMRLSIWNHGAYRGYLEDPQLQLAWFIDHASAVRDRLIAAGAGDPVEDPGAWGRWIADVERPAEMYRGRYQLRLEEARELLDSAPALSTPDELTVPAVEDPGALEPGALPGATDSARELAAEVLDDDRITLDGDGIADFRAERIDPRVSAVLLSLAERHPITVSVLETGHSRLTAGGSVSNHYVGRAVDISVVDGAPVTAANAAARELSEALASLPEAIRPSEIGTPWPLEGPEYFTDAGHQDHLHIGFDAPLAGIELPDVVPGSDGADAAGEPVEPVEVVPAAAPVDPDPRFSAARATASSGDADPTADGAGFAGEPTFRAAVPADEPARSGTRGATASDRSAGDGAAARPATERPSTRPADPEPRFRAAAGDDAPPTGPRGRGGDEPAFDAGS
ncbi:hypothetical protein [Paraconexibacter algicola]|uniref:Uncharacterized protein n=1 Tax=Paraconexibacter algicola TaxID=2133960 RepID=A0A2T4UGA9_9ACTN|nr:hypothetical protein [Paraconexibacter algicola]PTL58282.1 hypothetical protein C7Y72_00775 [Paraconexibacter algicola]